MHSSEFIKIAEQLAQGLMLYRLERKTDLVVQVVYRALEKNPPPLLRSALVRILKAIRQYDKNRIIASIDATRRLSLFYIDSKPGVSPSAINEGHDHDCFISTPRTALCNAI